MRFVALASTHGLARRAAWRSRRSKKRGQDGNKAILSHAILISANLSGANFADADLREVDFSKANLSDTYLRGAKLRGGIITPEQLKQARAT